MKSIGDDNTYLVTFQKEDYPSNVTISSVVRTTLPIVKPVHFTALISYAKKLLSENDQNTKTDETEMDLTVINCQLLTNRVEHEGVFNIVSFELVDNMAPQEHPVKERLKSV